MYWISDKETAKTLANKARDIETKIKSQCIKEEEQEKKNNIYTDTERPILDDILIENLNNYEVATIIYAKTNLNEWKINCRTRNAENFPFTTFIMKF